MNPRLALHLCNRVGLGPTPGEVERTARLDLDEYLDQQLRSESLSFSETSTATLERLPGLHLGARDILREYQEKKESQSRDELARYIFGVTVRTVSARILRAIRSERSLEETLVDFWFNHFNVFRKKFPVTLWAGNYERDAIRPYMLGRFADLLQATAKHPAMLFYLDNWLNTEPHSKGAVGRFNGINENYAREVLELHTVGVDGGYTQADVIELAHVLTGWGFRESEPLAKSTALTGNAAFDASTGFWFDSARHGFEDRHIMGQRFSAGGLSQGESVLNMLARHPSTARRLSFKLAQYYVADKPDDALVKAMTRTFLSSDGHIAATLQTMFKSDQFLNDDNYGTKFKTPYRFVVSAVRAAGLEVSNVLPLMGILEQLGQPIYGCLTPDGYKCTEDAWLSPDGMTRRISFALSLSQGAFRLTPVLSDAASSDRASTVERRSSSRVVDPDVVLAALDGQVSSNVMDEARSAPPAFRAGMILGSPEFMRC